MKLYFIFISISFLSQKVNSFSLSNITNSEGYFEIIVDRIEVIKETPGFGEWNLKVRKGNNTRLIYGYINLEIDFGNNLIVEYKCLRKQGGEFRYLPFSVPKQPFCDFTKNDIFFYPDLAKNSDFPDQSELECPTGEKKGNYSIYGVSFSLGQMSKVFLQSGEYAGENIFYFNGEIVSHYKVYSYINTT